MRPGNDPAFPVIESESDWIMGVDSSESTEVVKSVFSSGGLSKREYFAAIAMQAIISKHRPITRDIGVGEEDVRVARGAVDYADALIAELEERS